MLEFEAAYWRREIPQYGWGWWSERKAGIKKRRGQAGLQQLIDEMNRQRQEEKRNGKGRGTALDG